MGCCCRDTAEVGDKSAAFGVAVEPPITADRHGLSDGTAPPVPSPPDDRRSCCPASRSRWTCQGNTICIPDRGQATVGPLSDRLVSHHVLVEAWRSL